MTASRMSALLPWGTPLRSRSARTSLSPTNAARATHDAITQAVRELYGRLARRWDAQAVGE